MTDIERLAGVQGALEMLGNVLGSDSRMTSSDLSDYILSMAEDVNCVIQHMSKQAISTLESTQK